MKRIVNISPLQCDKLMMNNSKIAHELAMIPSVIGGGEYAFCCMKNKSILTTIDLRDEENIKFSGEITAKDIAVMDSIYTIYATGVKFFTLDQVVQVYMGDMNVDITQKMLREVKRSVDKLMSTIVRIDCTEEFRNRKIIDKDDKMIFNSNILYLKYLEGSKVYYTVNGRISSSKVVYCFLDEEAPVLFQYAEAIGQIITIPMNLLSVGSNTDVSVEICRYIYKQIHYMKYSHKHSRNKRADRIALYRYDSKEKAYVGVLPYVGIRKEDFVIVLPDGKEDTRPWRKKKQRVCKFVKSYLEMLVSEDVIKGYSPYYERNQAGNNMELAGYEIKI